MQELFDNYYRAGTINKHSRYYATWTRYADQVGLSHQPIDPWDFAAFLAGAAVHDKTYSPSKNRMAAASAICKLSGFPSPCQSLIVTMVTKGILKKLGIRDAKKEPLMLTHISAIYQRFAKSPDSPLSDVFMVLWITLLFEATLRFDDLISALLGAFIRTCEYVRIFLIGTKTDQALQGQWGVFAVSSEPDSAYQLWLRVLTILHKTWITFSPQLRARICTEAGSGDLTSLPLATMPLCCVLAPTGPNNAPFPKMSTIDSPNFGDTVLKYHSFNRRLKEMLLAVGLDANIFGTQSARRGSVTQADAFGLPDRLKRIMGRWRSEHMLGTYVDQDRNLESLLQVFALDHNLAASLTEAQPEDEAGASSSRAPVATNTQPRKIKTRRASSSPLSTDVEQPIKLDGDLLGKIIVQVWQDSSLQRGTVTDYFPTGWGKKKWNYDITWELDGKVRPVKLTCALYCKTKPHAFSTAGSWTLLPAA